MYDDKDLGGDREICNQSKQYSYYYLKYLIGILHYYSLATQIQKVVTISLRRN